MRRNILRVLTLVLVFAILVPSASMIGNEDSGDDAIVARVMFPGSSSTNLDYDDYVERVIAPYEGFVMAELSQKQLDYLEAQGATVIKEANLHTIGIDGYVFDTRFDEPKIGETLRAKPRAGTETSYLVQFVGPIKNEWQTALLSMGADPISYYPFNSMLVKTTPEIKASLGGLDIIQWVGDYHPAYKIRPALMELNEDERKEVKIITYAPEGVSAVLPALDETSIIGIYRGSDFGLVSARLGLDEIEKIAILDEVSYIEPIYDMELHNQNMQWVMQTNANGDREIWDGQDGIADTADDLTGEGQIITYADTGLDFDHSMFRESAGTITTGEIYNVTDPSRRKLIRYQPMAQWFEDRGIDKDGDGVPETQENPNGGAFEAYSDSWPSGAMSGHGTLVSGTGAGSDEGIAGSLNDGGAKGAKIYFQDIGSVWQNPQYGGAWDDYLIWIPDDYYWLFIDPYTNGSRVHSNSWGARNSDYDLEAMMVDKFMWEYPDFLVLSSNGNGGPGSGDPYDVGSPASAKSLVSVGSSWSPTGGCTGGSSPYQNNVAAYSSRGPTTDGRRKPTITAVGCGASSRSSGRPRDGSGIGAMMTWMGTSYASPAASGLAAMIRQYFEMGYYPNGVPLANNEFYPSAALVKAVMMASGQMMTGSYSDSKFEQKYPNLSQGWGRPMLDDVLHFSGETRKLLVVNNSEGLNTGEVLEYEFKVLSDTEHLKFFLAWSDYPAAAGATPAIVNNLDLQVEAPNGTTTFWGNRFPTAGNWLRRGFSVPGGAPDTLNTDEGVIITTGNAQVDNWVTTGVWKVRVMASGVPAGPQPFGLVVTGDLDLNYGIVTLDRKVYSESDTINIEVRDSDAVAVSVDLTSTTESAPETVTLSEVTAGSGIWKGSIDTDFGLPGADGMLQVKEGDTIVATYDDISPVHTSIATAVVDASGPKITNVMAEDITNAYAKITWLTDEPSTSKVYWGETTELEKDPIEVTSLMIDHVVELIGLKTDTVYIYDVESADWFGHSTRDDNGGLHYSFKTTAKAEILVIYGDDSFDKEDRYRSALDANGWVFNEWYVLSQGDPPLPTMQDYKVVIWQPGYEQYPPLEDTQRALITNYLDGGGRFFISSHDVQWAFGDSSGSGWYNAERANWLKSTLKAGYQIDPRMFTKIEGITGDPMSGSYVGANAPSYTPTRSGAAGDEIYPESAGGTYFPIWSASGSVDYGGLSDPSTSDFIALRWWSSAPNGTAGVGVWGGKFSKLVGFFFEFTRIEAGLDNSFVRDDILDKVITWLIGADHPDVTVSYPNGGEILSASPVTISWTATPFGTSIANQTIYYSDNAGQSWEYLASASPLATSYDWDISTFPNGNKYMVKVVAEDDGDPSLIGSDESDGTFTIMRPGGDLEGPITVPGSIGVQPHYVESGQPVWFNATIDDTDRGNSNIAAAEYFIQCAEPELTDYGTGTAMGASDTTFDSPIEDVTWTGTITSSSGWYTIWVHGQDVANNWGGFESRQFLLINASDPTIDLTPPSPPTNVMIVLEGGIFEDIRISWDQSPDDDGDPKNVEYYDIFYSESYSSDHTGYRNLASIAATASPNYNYLDALKGNGDPSNYFYYVSARDQSCNLGTNETQLSKFNRALVTGKNLVSIPLILEDESIGTVLQTANFEIAWSYDAADMSDPWKSYNPLKTFNDLTKVNYSMGLWINTNMDTNIVAVGKVPNNATIMLQAGWNLVGYPSFILRSVADALSGIAQQRIEGYDVNPPEYLKLYDDNDNMETGAGYWIKVDAAAQWDLSN